MRRIFGQLLFLNFRKGAHKTAEVIQTDFRRDTEGAVALLPTASQIHSAGPGDLDHCITDGAFQRFSIFAGPDEPMFFLR